MTALKKLKIEEVADISLCSEENFLFPKVVNAIPVNIINDLNFFDKFFFWLLMFDSLKHLILYFLHVASY